MGVEWGGNTVQTPEPHKPRHLRSGGLRGLLDAAIDGHAARQREKAAQEHMPKAELISRSESIIDNLTDLGAHSTVTRNLHDQRVQQSNPYHELKDEK